MAKHAPLSELHDWHLVHEEQDIRGWPVHDATGETIGNVDELLVSTDTELVEVIRLDNGDEYPARNVEIGDRVVYLQGQRPKTHGGTGSVVKVYDEARVRRRTDAAAPADAVTRGRFEDYRDDFRGHYEQTYGTGGGNYSVYEPAYRHGYDWGLERQHRERDYQALEPEIRRSYEARHGEGTYGQVQGAVRHAFDRSRMHRGEAGRTGGAV